MVEVLASVFGTAFLGVTGYVLTKQNDHGTRLTRVETKQDVNDRNVQARLTRIENKLDQVLGLPADSA